MTQDDDLLPLNWLIHHDVSRDLQPPPRPGKKTLDYILNKAQVVLEKSRANPEIRPPLSYATLILLALHSSPGPLPLSGIYKWIRTTFAFYDNKSGKEALAWMNSIRHNLSLNKCFMRVARGGRGKGGFWKLDPVCEDKLRKGEKFYRLRKRRVKKNRAVQREETISPDGQQCLEVVELETPATGNSTTVLTACSTNGNVGTTTTQESTIAAIPQDVIVPTEFEICQEWTLDWDGERVLELDLVDWNLIL